MNWFDKAVVKVFRNSFDTAITEYVTAWNSGDPLPATSGIDVSGDRALKYSAVFACNRVLAETLASVPLLFYRKKPDGTREQVTDLAVYDIFHNAPNDEMSPMNFKEACMTALNLGGNAVCERLVNARGELVGLYPYRWSEVTIRRNRDTSKLEYVITRDGQTVRTLRRDQVFHIPGPSIDGIVGMSPIEYMASAIRLGMSYEKFGNRFFDNGALPSGVFSKDGVLSDDAFERLKKELKENYTGMINHGKPMLLEDGLKFEAMTIKPIDAQLLESKKFQIEDVCRAYRVPLHLVQNLDKATNNNIEHQSLEFVMYTMLPWFKRWEENITAQLLTPELRRAGIYGEFKIDGLLRGDAKSRAEAYAIGRQWGWFSVNDIRRMENMNPIENGDIYLQPMNMIEAGTDPEQNKTAINAMAEKIYAMIQEGK